MTLTPFRPGRPSSSIVLKHHQDENLDISMEDFSSSASVGSGMNYPHAGFLPSPPAHAAGRSVANRLFFGEDDEEERPLSGPATPPQGRSGDESPPDRARKRASDQLVRSDDDASMRMHPSPAASGRFYRSPSHRTQAHLNKSPMYRTLDGRTVQSKNPFSPMRLEEDEHTQDMTPSPARRVTTDSAFFEAHPPWKDSLALPTSFYGENAKRSTQTDTPGGRYSEGRMSTSASFEEDHEERSLDGDLAIPTPLLRHCLTQRNSASNNAGFSAMESTGGPSARFTFTGSPIPEEKDASRASLDGPTRFHAYPHDAKIRRLHEGDDIVASSAHSSASLSRSNSGQSQLMVDTNVPKPAIDKSEDESPTDVLSFPALKSPVPPAPVKAKRAHRYTPVRRVVVPQTPMPNKRRVPELKQQRDADNETMDDSFNRNGRTTAQPSRFTSDFDVIGELGKGSFGTVYKVLSKYDGCFYAIKTAHQPHRSNADRNRRLQEVYALAALSDHADTATFHIVRYHQAWIEDDQRLFIQTELCTSTLAKEIRQNAPLTLQRRYKCLREIALALEFLHKQNMVHLDIKPENVFIKNDQFKLGDFGLVHKVNAHDEVDEGDSRYMSLDLLQGPHDDLTKCDLFSLGITLYEVCWAGQEQRHPSMSAGRPHLLPANGDEWQALRAGQIPLPDPQHGCPLELQAMIRDLMHPTPSQRPTASQLLQRPQLLSEQQKLLRAERHKVLQANLALVAQQEQLQKLSLAGGNHGRTEPEISVPPPTQMPPRRKLIRANTWNGGF